ncbi:FtsK/SpoIIIE domain-containing protein [Lactococcus lactis]|uniref:FtsK/SpoIIIE domain-containing protein n=1 Tax=Lactococcus lactis TaxID=1358 RepID=UPI00210A606B|nr:FtsK/SpoIIIE domain-containing protein [Lactococcus lactis]MCQ4972465.1 FtsK/SpoIIIE domain-containing protein [Lactococcus lactis]MCQ4998271.1 FtsK/SpoIIIE domain-containing protein [Lactococcus lactis]
MKKLVTYRGKRIRLYTRNLTRNWGLVLSVPFFLGLVAYHYFVTYAFFKVNHDLKQWTIYVQPVLITLLFILLSIIFAWYVIKSSRLRDGFFMRRYKMQMLALYMFSTNMVNKKVIKTEGGSKEKVSFTKAYYRHKKSIDTFTFQTGTQFHNQVIGIGKTLGEMYIADLVNIKWEMGFISYDFLTDSIGKRLNFDEVAINDGKISLMKGVEWDFEGLPHMIITGGTGGGKTYFIYSLIRVFAQIGRVRIADPKKSDLSAFEDFPAFKGLVFDEKDDIIKLFEDMVKLMDQRYLYMRKQPNYTIGKNYRFYGMKPEFIILDELAAYVTTLKDFREQDLFWDAVRLLVLKARQAGMFLIFATQRPDTTTLPGSLRDNMLCKVSTGLLTDQGYDMTFPNSKNKTFINKEGIKGRGYIDVGTGVPIEFYSPFVPSNFDFIGYFKNMGKMPFTDVSNVEITPEAKKVLEEVYNSVEEGEEFFRETQKSKVLKEHEDKKEKNMEKLMTNAGISYKEAMKKNGEK